MHLKFEITLDDYVKYSHYTNWARPGEKRRRIIYTWGSGVLLVELLVLRRLLFNRI